MILWIVFIAVVLCICMSVFLGRKESCFKERPMVDMGYWQQFCDVNKLGYDQKRLLSILEIIGSAFGSNPLKLRYDDKLEMFDSPYILLIKCDSLLDGAIEELVCEKLLPKTINKTDFSTIGDIVIRSMTTG